MKDKPTAYTSNRQPVIPMRRQYRVWWISQVPMKPFYVPVYSPLEGRKILDVLAEYDLFQLQNNIKPDFSNAGGLEVFDLDNKEDGPDGSWLEWADSEGNDISSEEAII